MNEEATIKTKILTICFKERVCVISYVVEESAIYYMNCTFLQFETFLETLLNMYEPEVIIASKNINTRSGVSDVFNKLSNTEVFYVDDCNFKSSIDQFNKFLSELSEEGQENIRKSIKNGILDLNSFENISAINFLLQCEYFENLSFENVKKMCFSECLTLNSKTYEELQIIQMDFHPSIHKLLYKDGLSLYTLINRCSTSMGKQLLKQWFFLTNSNMSDITFRHDCIEFFTAPENHAYVNELISNITGLIDIRPLLAKLRKGILTKDVWVKIFKAVSQVKAIADFLKNRPLPVFMDSLNMGMIDILQRIISSIELSIDFNHKDLHIRDDYDVKLSEMKEKYNSLNVTLDSVAQQLIDDLPDDYSINSLSVVYIPQLGFLTTINKSHGSVPPNYDIVFETDTNFYCKNTRVIDLDNSIGDIYQNILDYELKILVRLSTSLLKHSFFLILTWEKVSTLDCLLSLTVVAVEKFWIRPTFTDKHEMIIVNGRHPIIDHLSDTFIPNNTIVKSDESHIHVLTGPNGSGKSIYIKQIGLILFLAHIGSFVPAEEAVIPHIDRIFMISQSSVKAYTPFSSSFTDDVLLLSKVLQNSTAKTVILIDEFGRTSNPDDGASLLSGLIKYLSQKEDTPYVFLSTHYRNAISQSVLDPKSFVHFSMTVTVNNDPVNNQTDVIFRYILQKNTEDLCSFGFNCALKSGVPVDVVQRAIEVAKMLQNNITIEPSSSTNDYNRLQKMKKAAGMFLQWNGEGSPRALLSKIYDIVRS